jgi:putative ABC transport system permease protein
MRVADALYRGLLLLFPASIRRRHGADMALHFTRQRAMLRGHPAALVLLWVRVVVETARHGIALRVASLRWPEGIGADIVFALRLHRRNLQPIALVIGGLALAVGLSTALITVTRSITKTSADLPAPDRFYFAGRAAVSNEPYRPVTTADLPGAIARLGETSAAGILTSSVRRIDDRSLDRPASAQFVSAGFFRMTEARFERGGGFHTEPVTGVNPPVVISRPAWRHHFGFAEDIVGRTVRLNGRSFTVVGVAARGFSGISTSAPAFWAPLGAFDPEWRDDGRLRESAAHAINLLVRLPEGGALPWAVDRLATVYDGPVLRAVGDGGGFAEERELTAVVGVLCALLLLLGCANVSTLLAATNTERHHELRTRVALGAGRARLIRQLLTEGLLVGGLASVGGILLALWLGPMFLSLGAFSDRDVHLDHVALASAVIAALGSGVISSLWPAWRASAPERRVAPQGRRVLLTVQATACVCILGVAGLLERGAVSAQTVDVGFDADKVWTINALAGRTRSLEDGRLRLDRAVQALSAHPGIAAVSVGAGTLFGGGSSAMGTQGPGGAVRIYTKRIDTAWFRTLGVPLVAGRIFTDADMRVDDVVVISHGLVQRVWGDDDPVGTDAGRLHPSLTGVVVIGVVADALPHSLLDAGSGGLAIYRPVRLGDIEPAQIFIRSERSTTEAFEMIRSVMMTTFPGERFHPTQLSEVVAGNQFALRAPARALTLASTAVLILGLIGIAGVTATYVRLRRRDLAVHVVLGADRAALRTLVARQYLLPVVIGVAGGAALAALAGAGMRALLVGVHPIDPLALGGAGVLLVSGAWVASLASARRATTVQPAEVLRD